MSRSSAATWPTTAHRTAQFARIAYMPQGLGRNLYPTLSVFENLDFFGRLFGQSQAERRRRITELLRRPASTRSRPAGRQALRRHEAEAQPLLRADPRSRPADPRRAHHGRRPAVARTILGSDQPHPRPPSADERAWWPPPIWTRRSASTGWSPWTTARCIATGHAGARSCSKAGRADARRGLHRAAAGSQARAAPEGDRTAALRRTTDDVPAIEADGLTRRFGDFTAVDHVSFRIERGEIFGFLGSNGCGKSTTMKMLTGLLPATEGTAKLFGKPMGSNDMEARRHVGYMSQAFSLYTELTVRQNLELHARALPSAGGPDRGPRQGTAAALRSERRRRRPSREPAARASASACSSPSPCCTARPC